MSSDIINRPAHYTSHHSGVESIEICEKLDFCLGNAVKYLWRSGKKGNPTEDLQKAAWYLRRVVDGAHVQRPQFKGSREVLYRVVTNEPEGSVLRDVLLLVVDRIFAGSTPRVVDALARVESEISERKRRSL